MGGLLLFGAAITGASFAASELATYLVDRGDTDGPVVVAAALISIARMAAGHLPGHPVPAAAVPGRTPAVPPMAPVRLALRRRPGLPRAVSLIFGEEVADRLGRRLVVANPFYVPAIGRLHDLRCRRSAFALVGLLLRQRRVAGAAVPAVSTGVERQQIKWVALALAFLVGLPSCSRRSPARSGSTRT